MELKRDKGAKYILLLYCVLASNFLYAQNASMVVQLNKAAYKQGDTINIEAALADYKILTKTATVQLNIENIKTGHRWKFRYPLINGYISAKLKIDSNMGDGVYAFNFLLQKAFFSVSGNTNVGKKDKFLNYVMISKNKQTIIDVIPLSEKKDFSIRNLLFQDSAFIIFSKPNKKNSDLLIDIKTPLDSSFAPLAYATKFITIGSDTPLPINKTDTTRYSFKQDNTQYKIIMPEVVVKSKSNKRLEDFDNENSSGGFSGGDAIILDGLTSQEMANAPDLYIYLSIKVGGLRLETDGETGNRSFSWRGQPTEIYINEIKLDPEIPIMINPSDIAMIKIFRPGTMLTADASGGGAIAIYTKTGDYKQATNRNYSFYILGYTGIESTWK